MREGDESDEVLMAWVARGDVSAFERLYDRHGRWVRSWAAHALGSDRAEDAVQEVFMRVWRAAPQFDARRGLFGTWLGAITRHHVARQLRSGGSRQQVVAGEAIEAALVAHHRVEPSPEEPVGRHELERAVLSALRALPDEQRMVVVLAYFAGMTQSQIADHLGIPLGTTKKRIRLAMQKLRLALEHEGREPQRLRVVTEE